MSDINEHNFGIDGIKQDCQETIQIFEKQLPTPKKIEAIGETINEAIKKGNFGDDVIKEGASLFNKMVSIRNEMKREGEAKRKPYNAMKSAVSGEFNEAINRFKDRESSLNGMITNFRIEKDKAARLATLEIAKKQAADAEKREKEAKKLAAKTPPEQGGSHAEVLAAQAQTEAEIAKAEIAKAEKSDGKISGTRKVLRGYEVEDETAIPAQYWVLNDALIKRVLTGGKEIAGIKPVFERVPTRKI